jgi:hypothetical protein
MFRRVASFPELKGLNSRPQGLGKGYKKFAERVIPTKAECAHLNPSCHSPELPSFPPDVAALRIYSTL